MLVRSGYPAPARKDACPLQANPETWSRFDGVLVELASTKRRHTRKRTESIRTAQAAPAMAKRTAGER